MTRRLGFVERGAVAAAPELLREDGFARRAGEHWALTLSGWDAARALDPFRDIE